MNQQKIINKAKEKENKRVRVKSTLAFVFMAFTSYYTQAPHNGVPGYNTCVFGVYKVAPKYKDTCNNHMPRIQSLASPHLIDISTWFRVN